MSQRKMFDAQIKSIDSAKGLVTSVVAVFKNVDLQGDRIIPGAFDRSITKWKAKMAQGQFLPVVWGHQDHSSSVIGKVLDMRETGEGLEVDSQLFLHKAAGKDAFDLMSEGVLPGSSFAYDIIKAKRAQDGVQDLIELDLIEVGPTIYPANPETRLVGVKADALDDSAWDKGKAMGACSSAADYRSICAGEHSAGEPDQAQHWALPHHYLGRGANAAGVAAARQRFDQTQDLTNRAAARRHLFETHRLPSDAKRGAEVVTKGGVAPLSEEAIQTFATSIAKSFEKAVEAKVGRELSAKNSDLIRQMHDVAHQLLGMPDHAEGADKTEEPEGAKVEDPPVKAEVRAQIEALTASVA